jgi:hypothetical protein
VPAPSSYLSHPLIMSALPCSGHRRGDKWDPFISLTNLNRENMKAMTVGATVPVVIEQDGNHGI